MTKQQKQAVIRARCDAELRGAVDRFLGTHPELNEAQLVRLAVTRFIQTHTPKKRGAPVDQDEMDRLIDSMREIAARLSSQQGKSTGPQD